MVDCEGSDGFDDWHIDEGTSDIDDIKLGSADMGIFGDNGVDSTEYNTGLQSGAPILSLRKDSAANKSESLSEESLVRKVSEIPLTRNSAEPEKNLASYHYRGTSRSKRKKKPAGLPKRPLSAYNIFFQQERLKMQQEGLATKLTFEEFGKIIGKRWKELPEDQRKQYNDRACEDSIRYRNEMDEYKAGHLKRNKTLSENKSGLVQHESWSQEPPRITSYTQSNAPHQLHGCYPGFPRSQLQHQVAVSYLSQIPQLQWGQQIPHRVIEAAPGKQPDFPVPPGMEMTLPDSSGQEKRYRVKYSMFSMPRSAAEQYIAYLGATSGMVPAGASGTVLAPPMGCRQQPAPTSQPVAFSSKPNIPEPLPFDASADNGPNRASSNSHHFVVPGGQPPPEVGR